MVSPSRAPVAPVPIRTPDQRLRVFVSSTLGELAAERAAAREAIEGLRLAPVMFELGARPHPPRELYRAYLDQSHVFVGIYWQRYGWVAPGETISGLEDEYRLAGDRPRLLYLKRPAEEREDRLSALVADFQLDDRASYKQFSTPEELARLVADDLSLLLSERFEAATPTARGHRGARVSGVPTPLTPTFGRDDDIEAVLAELDQGHRFITLTGPGGVGKTRLAVEVAQRAGAFPDGVVLVPLVSARDRDGALHLIGDELDTPFEAATALDTLTTGLRDQHFLLVLDNVEQVDGLGVVLVELLERLPDLHVLVTSRQAMRVRGEVEIPVRALPRPDPRSPLETLAAEPAVRLFVARAQAVSRDFVLTDANAGDVAALVARVDGLPLAIELAAARARVLSPAALLDRLTSSLDVLRDSAPDLPDRQRTLRATIDWSYDLLSAREQGLFADLAAFAGGWTVDAAEQVCTPAGVDSTNGTDGTDDLLDLLASLLDKSLVAIDLEGHVTEPRFHMLETIRAYAGERLAGEERAEAVARRHLDWARRLAERAQPHLCGPGQHDWVARMAPERRNLDRAVATAMAAGDHSAVIELAWDVIVLYFVQDAVAEPDAWLQQVADAGPSLDELTEAKLRSLLALTRIHHGDYREVHDALTGPLAIFRARGMAFESAVALHQLGFVHYHLDHDTDQAVAALTESSALFESVDHDWGVALAEAMLGSVFAAEGDLDAAERCQLRSLDRARRISSEQQTVQALGQLTLVRLLQGRLDAALDLLSESGELLQAGRYRTDAANALDACAVIAHQRGDHLTAAVATSVAASERDRLGIEPWPTLRPVIDRSRRGVRAALGESAFSDLCRQTSRDEVFDTLAATLDAIVRP